MYTQYMCTSIKGNEVLIRGTTWMNLDSLKLRERCEEQKTTYLCFHLYEIVHNRQMNEIISKLMVARGWGKEGQGSECLMGKGFFFCVGMKVFLT